MCCDKVGVVYRRYPYLVKDQVHILARTAQIRKEKQQSIITLRHEGQSIWSISITFTVSSSAVNVSSQKTSRAMMKLALMRTATGKEDPEFPLLQRISSLELPASDGSPNKYVRVQVTDTSQHQLFRGDCVNQAFMVALLQGKHY